MSEQHWIASVCGSAQPLESSDFTLFCCEPGGQVLEQACKHRLCNISWQHQPLRVHQTKNHTPTAARSLSSEEPFALPNWRPALLPHRVSTSWQPRPCLTAKENTAAEERVGLLQELQPGSASGSQV